MKMTGGEGPASGGETGFPYRLSVQGNGIRIVAELPEIHEELIRMDLEGRTLIISADGRGRKYRMAIPLPLEARLARKQFRDGVLDLCLERVDG
jgi:HSP20 family molecular chaperone IbpA